MFEDRRDKGIQDHGEEGDEGPRDYGIAQR